MADGDQVVALGLLTINDLEVLGECFDRVFPIDEVPCFGVLLQAIDDADRALRRARESGPHPKIITSRV